MKKTDSKRVVREYRMVHKARPERIFPLLCPVREYDWIPLWRCELLYTQSGVAELGCVFRTDFGDQWGPETWVVSHYRPGEKIAFVRTGALRTTRYEVILEGDRDDTALTHLTWRQEITGLNPEGNKLVAAPGDEEFQAMMAALNEMLAYYLATGKSLSLAHAADKLREESAG